MSERPIVDTKVLAQQFKEQAPPYQCPVCKKTYRSMAGIMYHIGHFRGNLKVPRCMLGGEGSATNSPIRTPGSPMSARKKTPKREALTWAESQLLVEVEFANNYQRIEIDSDLDMIECKSDIENDCENVGEDSLGGTGKRKGGSKSSAKAQTPCSRGSGAVGKSSTGRIKRRSKLKTPSTDAQTPQCGPTLPQTEFTILDNVDFPEAPSRDPAYYRFIDQSNEEIDEMVEYDMDEEDTQWLTLVNDERKTEGLTSVPQEAFELLMDRLEKECEFETQAPGNGNEPVNPYNIDENAVCCICNDGECHNTNAILFCDMCNLAVHQECYGVPYIPEGQWLCRRCLQSPSCSVDCVLCPNKGGAFKQTIDGRWAHVICALWIPEVQFANTVFLEPIDGIRDVPSARWKLMCYICRKRKGACIQCAKANCYVAFHVTCAQQAGLCMKLEMMKNGDITKSAYCDSHTPPGARKKLLQSLKDVEDDPESDAKNDEDPGEDKETKEGEESVDIDVVSGGDASAKKKGKGESKIVKRARKKIEEQEATHVVPVVVNLPFIPKHRLEKISNRVSLHKRSQFIPKLVSYWKLKRQSRNGVPFLRRLQANSKKHAAGIGSNLTKGERDALFEQLGLWKSLRHDLERARMLVELVRKREKLKREQLRMCEETSRLSLTPTEVVMKRIIHRLMAKDPADIFAEPVSVEEVPDYPEIITDPMDFGTMKKKVESHSYSNFKEFEDDFYLVWNNAMVYNAKDTIYYKAAARIRDAGKHLLETTHKQFESAGINLATGMHEPDVEEPPPLTPNTVAIVQQKPLDMFTKEGEYAEETPPLSARERLSSTNQTLDEKIELLEEQLSVLDSQCKGSTKKYREKQLRKEMNVLKRQLRMRDKANDPPGSPPRPRQQASSPARDAEGLASQLLHGSLRLTDSRRAILSSSGIRLEERVSALQKQQEIEREEEEMKLEQEKQEKETEEKEIEKNEDNICEDNDDNDDNTRDIDSSKVHWKVVERNRRKRTRRKNRSYPMLLEKTKRRRESRTRFRLTSETSTSEVENVSMNGYNTRTRAGKQKNSTGSTSSMGGYEPQAEYSSDDRGIMSSLSDNASEVNLTTCIKVDVAGVPSASSLNDLTVVPSSIKRKRRVVVETESDSDTPTKKRKKRVSNINSAGKDTPNKKQPQQQQQLPVMKGMMNGLSNGVSDPQPLDLVWAKCRGYPPFPALVIDPDMDPKGQKISGEFIKAPSEDVLEHREKNPHNTILVRFFDGRRTWQWLPPSKIDALGDDKEFDHNQVGMSGASRRSVQQAYDRAMRYFKKTKKLKNSNREDEEQSDNSCSS